MKRLTKLCLWLLGGALAAWGQPAATPGLPSLLEQADRVYDTGNYPEAERLYRQLAGLPDAQHADRVEVLNNLGLALRFQAKFAEAETVLHEALAGAQTRTQGTDEASVRNSLGGLYLDQGDFVRAEQEKRASLALYQARGTPRQAAIGHQNLAVVYAEMGRFPAAQASYRQALAILRTAEPQGAVIATVLDNLARIHRDTGDYQEALRLGGQSLALSLRQFPPTHPYICNGFQHLGLSHWRLRQYEAAERHFRESLRRQQDPHSAAAALVRVNLGDMLGEMGRATEGLALAREAITDQIKALGARHWVVGRTHEAIGGLLLELGRCAEAETEFATSLDLYRARLGVDHPRVAVAAANLAQATWCQGRVADARRRWEDAHEVETRLLALMGALGGEERKRQYLETLDQRLGAVISFHQTLAQGHGEALRLGLRAVLQRKEWALADAAAELAAARRRLAADDRRLLDELATVRGRHANLALRGPGNLAVTTHQAMVRELARRERELAAQLAAVAPRQAGADVTVEAVQAALPVDGSLVEVASYQPFDPAHRTRKPARRYIAYVLRPAGDPVAVDLGAAAAMDRLAVTLRDALRAPAGESWREPARQLALRLIAPLRPALGDARQVTFALEGALSFVPVAVLPDERGRLAMERWTVSYLASGRDLVRPERPVPGRQAALILAAPHFGIADAAPGQIRRVRLFPFRATPLPGTAREAAAIGRLLPGARVLTGTRATEAALKHARGPRWLHIATHGFLLAPGSAAQRATVRALVHTDPTIVPDHPLLRSGLLFTGASGGGHGGEDGVLTALEASSLDLQGTQLVVLSACDTAAGDPRRGEALAGLRRAFAMAGARSQVVTAWKVQDDATSDLMVAFYRQLREGQSRAEALRHAQRLVRRMPGRAHPYYWGAFLLSGDAGRL